MANEDETRTVRVLCPKPIVLAKEPGLQWLIGSPFFTRFTLLSTFRCIHALPSSPSSPDFEKESDDLRMLIPKGFEIIGSAIVGPSGSDPEKVAVEAVDASRRMRELLRGEGDGGLELEARGLIGAVAESSTDGVRFFVSVLGDSKRLRPVSSVIYEDHPERFLWERGCLVRCRLPLKLPVFLPVNGQPNVNEVYSNAIRTVADNFKDPHNVYIAEASNKSLEEVPQPVIIYGSGLDFLTDLSQIKLSCGIAQDSSANSVSCSLFCSKTVPILSSSALVENADIIHLTVLHNRSSKSSVCSVPVAGYIPALEEAHLLVVEYELEVLCYAAKDLPLTYALSKLVIPALVEQLNLMKNATLPNFQMQLSQLHPYHFSPPGVLHPITVIYELSYGETELKQVELRRSLHMRLGLPLDRPLLRVANALSFSINDHSIKRDTIRKGSLLKDVHLGIPSSEVSGGLASLVQGSYEYYHYLQDGFDDSGWGCAYRSLQTIVSWFKLQHYTSVDVPSHREIQQSLVEIGDKDPSFIGSREWIGAIELSFVLEKLAGVSCKVINVRSGAELPEKCRELALHFESQGTPIMIGGGVLAYTLLGVDYSEVSGDCAFLILDPHYTGTDERKKIMSGDWCGWKKAIDSKGKNFFLHDKFYNLLLPQRPNMV